MTARVLDDPPPVGDVALRLLRFFLPVLIFLSSFRVAIADQAFCTAYATAAITTIQDAQRHQCPFSGPRWDPRQQVHFDACMSWGDDAKNSLAETNARAQDLAVCKADRTQPKVHNDPIVTQVAGRAFIGTWCQNYALTAVSQNDEYLRSKCSPPSLRWNNRLVDHVNACMGQGANYGRVLGERDEWSGAGSRGLPQQFRRPA
jgi:hypothetical protein